MMNVAEVSWSSFGTAEWESQQSVIRGVSWVNPHCESWEDWTWSCYNGESSQDSVESRRLGHVMSRWRKQLRYYPGCVRYGWTHVISNVFLLYQTRRTSRWWGSGLTPWSVTRTVSSDQYWFLFSVSFLCLVQCAISSKLPVWLTF